MCVCVWGGGSTLNTEMRQARLRKSLQQEAVGYLFHLVADGQSFIIRLVGR